MKHHHRHHHSQHTHHRVEVELSHLREDEYELRCEMQLSQINQLDKEIRHAKNRYHDYERELIRFENERYELHTEIAVEEGLPESSLIKKANIHVEPLPTEPLFLELLAGVAFHDLDVVINTKKNFLNQLDLHNQSLRRKIDDLIQINAALKRSLTELKIEKERVNTFLSHQALLASPSINFQSLERLKPLTQPIARFRNNQSKEIPSYQGYTLPSLALIQDNIDVFILAINCKNYPLNLTLPEIENPISRLSKRPDAINILQQIPTMLDEACIDFLVQNAIILIETKGLNPDFKRQQGELLTWLLTHKKINLKFQEKLSSLVLTLSSVHFELTNAFFSNPIGNFSVLRIEDRLIFLKALTEKLPINYSQILSWYTTNNHFKINELYFDFSHVGRNQDALNIISLAIDDRHFFDRPHERILEQVLQMHHEGSSLLFNKFLQLYAHIFQHWFRSETITHNNKMELICYRPDLFTPRQAYEVFLLKENLLNATLSDDYYEFVGRIKPHQNIAALEPLLLAYTKTRFEKTTSANEIMNFAKQLEVDWKSHHYSSQSIEVMLKIAKNSILKLLRDNQARPSDELADFMAKHRINRYLFFKFLPLPSTLWYTPSTLIFHQYKRALTSDGVVNEQEFTKANQQLERQIEKAEADINIIFRR